MSQFGCDLLFQLNLYCSIHSLSLMQLAACGRDAKRAIELKGGVAQWSLLLRINGRSAAVA